MNHLHRNGLIPVLTQSLQVGANHDGREPCFIELGACLPSGISCFFASHVGKDQNFSPIIVRTIRYVVRTLRLHL